MPTPAPPTGELGDRIKDARDSSCAITDSLTTLVAGRNLEELQISTVQTSITDGNLTSIASANPAAAEFAVITQEGDIRICGFDGKTIRTLKQKNRVITAVAYSPDGQLLLAGTEDGALLVWNMLSGECAVAAEKVADRSAWEELRREWIGRKQGIIRALLAGIRDVEPEERKAYGGGVNRLKLMRSW